MIKSLNYAITWAKNIFDTKFETMYQIIEVLHIIVWLKLVRYLNMLHINPENC